MSDFRRFCVALLVVHGLLAVCEMLRFIPEVTAGKRVLCAALIAAGWVAALASHRMRAS